MGHNSHPFSSNRIRPDRQKNYWCILQCHAQQKPKRERERDGGGRIVEEDDSDAGGDGGGEGPLGVQRPVRAPADPAQQVPAGRVLPAVEVRGGAALVREMRVRARHGEDAQDAEDPRGGGQAQAGLQAARHSPHPQTRQCLAPPPFFLLLKGSSSMGAFGETVASFICSLFVETYMHEHNCKEYWYLHPLLLLLLLS